MTNQTRYRIVCADGDVNRTIYDKAEAEYRRRILDDELRWHCGPHTVEPIVADPACERSTCTSCKAGKPAECAAPPYPGPVVR